MLASLNIGYRFIFHLFFLQYTLISELTLSLWYLGNIFSGWGKTHNPVPLHMTLQFSLVAK